MRWYIGIDGGGTKTAFVIGTAEGIRIREITRSGCSYQQIGIDSTVELLVAGVQDLLTSVGADMVDCGGICIGLPCFGENHGADIQIERQICDAFAPVPVKIVNDSVVGWAGALGCNEGIHLVAGTGSMALGCGTDGRFARSGGWTEFFGDEGSCYWIGREAMSLFSKEADGRMPKSELYRIVCEKYALRSDFDFISIVNDEIAPYRDKVAAFQRFALEAANMGDLGAQAIYRRAAEELAQIVIGVKSLLCWSNESVKVSYFGGLFHAGDFVIAPLAEELRLHGCILQPAIYTAAEGALLLTIEEFVRKEN